MRPGRPRPPVCPRVGGVVASRTTGRPARRPARAAPPPSRAPGRCHRHEQATPYPYHAYHYHAYHYHAARELAPPPPRLAGAPGCLGAPAGRPGDAARAAARAAPRGAPGTPHPFGGALGHARDAARTPYPPPPHGRPQPLGWGLALPAARACPPASHARRPDPAGLAVLLRPMHAYPPAPRARPPRPAAAPRRPAGGAPACRRPGPLAGRRGAPRDPASWAGGGRRGTHKTGAPAGPAQSVLTPIRARRSITAAAAGWRPPASSKARADLWRALEGAPAPPARAAPSLAPAPPPVLWPAGGPRGAARSDGARTAPHAQGGAAAPGRGSVRSRPQTSWAAHPSWAAPPPAACSYLLLGLCCAERVQSEGGGPRGLGATAWVGLATGRARAGGLWSGWAAAKLEAW
jgi:hypothetical protein